MAGLWDRTQPGNLFETHRTMLPLMLLAAAGAVNAVVDRAFLARFSDLAVAAAVPAAVLSSTLTCFFLMTAGYSSTFVAHAFGRGDREGMRKAFVHGLILACLFVPIVLLAIPGGHLLFAHSGHAAELVASERTYFDIVTPAAVLHLFSGVIAGYFNGQGRTAVTGTCGALGCLVNLALDPLFIFTFRGGLVGAAWASVGGVLATFAALFFVWLREDGVSSCRCRLDLAFLLRLFQLGAPTGVMNLFGAAVFSVFVLATGRLDALSLAVSNICFGVNSVFYVFVSGLRDGATVLAGRFHGRGDTAAIRRVFGGSVLLALGYAVLVGGGALALSGWIATTFRAADSSFEPTVFRTTLTAVLAVMTVRALVESVVEPSVGVLKGVGDTAFTMFARMASGLFVWLPLISLVSAYHPTVVAYWLTMPVHLAFTSALLVWRLR